MESSLMKHDCKSERKNPFKKEAMKLPFNEQTKRTITKYTFSVCDMYEYKMADNPLLKYWTGFIAQSPDNILNNGLSEALYLTQIF